MRDPGLSLDNDPSDDELAALERACFQRPWCAVAYRDLRRNPLVRACVLRDAGGEALGFACFQRVEEEAELLRIGVVPARRGEGWGRRLLEAFLEQAGAAGARRFYLEVRAGNGPATRLYETAGFRRIAVRAGYFQDPPEDALIYLRSGEPATQADQAAGG